MLGKSHGNNTWWLDVPKEEQKTKSIHKWNQEMLVWRTWKLVTLFGAMVSVAWVIETHIVLPKLNAMLNLSDRNSYNFT